MSISPKLGVRQTQQLTMTPELRQSIQLLQLTTIELQAFLTAELESNPLLEQAQSNESEIETTVLPENREILDTQFSKTDPSNASGAFDGGGENLPGVFADTISPLRGQAGVGDGQISGFAENVAGASTLRDNLISQLGMMTLCPLIHKTAVVIVDELDDDGYLRTGANELATRLGVPLDIIEDAHSAILACEPVGVGARSLSECLHLQLAERGELTPEVVKILEKLDDLANMSNARFADDVGIELSALSKILERLRALNPAPGLIFDSVHTDIAVPEVQVTRNNLGGWSVELNSDTLPTLLINNHYSALVESGSKNTKEFITNCTGRARWLINSLDQRAKTILRVAVEIVRLQDSFFSQGVSALRPMTLRDVAENLDIHESTVSRVTSGKYLICERGTFELKFFFSSGLKNTGGTDSHSSRSVQDKIRRLIESEDPKKTISDEGLVKALKSDGIDIARRTVTKYREGMRIPSSVQRRRRKAPQARNIE